MSEIDWAERAKTRVLKTRAKPEMKDEVEPDCTHVFVPGKKHCRLCGERELNVWIDKQNGLKR